jgi:hypothetical protein
MSFYGTAAGFRVYHEARGRDVSGALFVDDDDVEASLLVAAEWLDGKYGSLFSGLKVGAREQVREWPRNGSIDRYGYAIAADVAPVEVINATYEAAYKDRITPGSLSVDWTPGKYKRVSIDGAVSVEYMQFNSVFDLQTRIAMVDQILAPILTGSLGGYSGLSGAIARV